MSIQANFPAIKPTLLLDFANTEALDPRITFTRASTGTYYDGKTVAKAEENLLTFSEQFDNAAWTKSATTVTANGVIAPDGTLTADKLVENTATSSHFTAQSVSAQTAVYALSTYAKAAERSFVSLGFDGLNAWFNLSNGTAGTVEAGLTASITDVGNGWYRCTILRTVAAAGSKTYAIYATTGNGTVSYAGDGTSGIFIWGAQLEQRASATAYTPTTTQPVTNYIPVLLTAASGVPRFEHNPVTGESLGLEIEEQRTNLLTYSSEFDNAAWTKNKTTVVSNTAVAPDGATTANLVYPNASGTSPHEVSINRFLGSQPTAARTNTIYVKAAGWRWVYFIDPAGSFNVWFDLQNGVVGTQQGNAVGKITSAGNGWFRIEIFRDQTAGIFYHYLSFSNADNSTVCTVSGTNGVLVWGAQTEAGAFPTSYIPTVASQVTRAADSAVMTGANFSSWFNQSTGTISAEFDVVSTAGLGMSVFSIAAPSNNGYLLYKGASQAGLYAYTDNNFSNSLGNLSANTLAKAAIAYNGISNAGILNGAAPLSIVPVAVKTPTQMQIGASSGVTLSGRIRKITYYPARVTNAQLQALTS